MLSKEAQEAVYYIDKLGLGMPSGWTIIRRELMQQAYLARKAEAELDRVKAILSAVENEIAHAEANDLRLTPELGKAIGRPAVPISYLLAAMQADQ